MVLEVGATILEEVFPRSFDLSLLLEAIITLITTRGLYILSAGSVSIFTFTFEPSFFLFWLLFIFRIALEDDIGDGIDLGNAH